MYRGARSIHAFGIGEIYMKYMHDTRAKEMEEGHGYMPKRGKYTTIHKSGEIRP